MDSQTWKDLGLPSNLFSLLNKKIVSSLETQNTIQSNTTSKESKNILQTQQQALIETNQDKFDNAINKIKNDKSMFNAYKDILNNTKNEIEKKPTNQIIQEEDETKISVEKYLENIINEIRDSSIYIPLLKNIYSIVENIIKNPSEAKFKRIKAFGGFIEKSVSLSEASMKFFNWVYNL